MNQPRTFNGHLASPKLTSEQEAIVFQKLAEGATQEATAKAAGCTIGRVREFKTKAANAKAIKELQTSTTLLKLNQKQNDLMEKMVAHMAALDSRITHTNGELKRIAKAVMYQKLSLTKTKETLRDMKAENKKLRAYIHRTNGVDPDSV